MKLTRLRHLSFCLSATTSSQATKTVASLKLRLCATGCRSCRCFMESELFWIQSLTRSRGSLIERCWLHGCLNELDRSLSTHPNIREHVYLAPCLGPKEVTSRHCTASKSTRIGRAHSHISETQRLEKHPEET